MLRLCVDLHEQNDSLYGIDVGLGLAEMYFAGKILPSNLEIVMRPEQLTNHGFWKGLLGARYNRSGSLNHLCLKGFGDRAAHDLALYLHDKGIQPMHIRFNGRLID